jgi:molecular chaperone DnaJ
MTTRDYYEILGVSRNASLDELKQAFRKLARQYHPDVNSNPDAEERFKELNEAYAVLSDPDKRAAYDRFGHAGVRGPGGGVDFTVDFSDFADIFGEFFGFGRTARQTRNVPRRGTDLQYRLDLTFEEAVFGVEKEIEITRDEVCSRCNGNRAEPGTSPVKCTTCNGRGEVRQARQTILGSMVQVTTCPTCYGTGETIATPCRNCNGRGLERQNRRKVVTVPAGVDNGNQIRLAGEGQPGVNGGPNGNLYLLVNVQPHKHFTRNGYDIHYSLNVNVAQATLGAEVEIPTVDGVEQLRIPAGIQPGKELRIKGKGVPHLQSNGRGDQIISINVVVPRNLTEEQRELFEKLSLSFGSNVPQPEKGFFDKLKDAFSN